MTTELIMNDGIEIVEMGKPYELAEDNSIYLFRYEIHVTYTSNNQYEATIYRHRPRVIRETPACYVIDDFGRNRFIRKEQSGKRFAYLNENDAIASLKKRIEWRTIHANNSFIKAKYASELFKRFELKRSSNS